MTAEEYARLTLSKDCCDMQLEVYKKVIDAFNAGKKSNNWEVITECKRKSYEDEDDGPDVEIINPND